MILQKKKDVPILFFLFYVNDSTLVHLHLRILSLFVCYILVITPLHLVQRNTDTHRISQKCKIFCYLCILKSLKSFTFEKIIIMQMIIIAVVFAIFIYFFFIFCSSFLSLNVLLLLLYDVHEQISHKLLFMNHVDHFNRSYVFCFIITYFFVLLLSCFNYFFRFYFPFFFLFCFVQKHLFAIRNINRNEMKKWRKKKCRADYNNEVFCLPNPINTGRMCACVRVSHF